MNPTILEVLTHALKKLRSAVKHSAGMPIETMTKNKMNEN